MERCREILKKLIRKDVFYEQEDVTQNIFAFRFVMLCILFYTFDMLLNMFHIFIVDQKIFQTGYLIACGIMLVYLLLLFGLGLEHWLTKYVSVSAIGMMVLAASATLTYHMIIIIMIPIIIASMYASKGLSVYAFHFTIFSIIISTYVGYYYGVCDANMVLLTATSLKNISHNGRFLLDTVNQNPLVTLALYYVLPRSLMAIAFFYVSTSVNRVVRKSMENAWKMKQEAIMDDMTGLYNKNHLLAVIQTETKRKGKQPVAVVYWDVNRLKYVNDTYGHLYGDQLIIRIADSIRIVTEEEMCAYRYGGDEFLLLIPDGDEVRAEAVIGKWKQNIKEIQQECEIPVSASVGYAVGIYENLMELIAIADRKMYEDKEQRRI